MKKNMPTKPLGPNKLTTQRLAFLEYYFNPKSNTYQNALQSAKRAGYSENYAKQLISKDLPWITEYRKELTETVETEDIVRKARENLKDAVEGKLDKDEKPVYRYKATEFSLSRADKDFSDKQKIDVTSAGLPIQEALTQALLKVYQDNEEDQNKPS